MSNLVGDLQQELYPEQWARLHIQNNCRSSTVLPKIGLKQCLTALIRNALEASEDYSTVHFSISEDAYSVYFQVRDQGCGIPEQLLPQIGEPFFTTKEPGRGMGLGLFIAKTLLERSGAELSFANGSDASAHSKPESLKIGAIVEVVWPRSKIDAIYGENAVPIGENQPLTI